MNLPKRSSKYRIGKQMGNALYVHKAYSHILPQEPFKRALSHISNRLNNEPYSLIKYDQKKGSFTFIWCKDFDSAHEPSMGIAILCSPDPDGYNGFKTKVIWPNKDNPWIYHHKWLMVADDYTGFNVEESKDRSRSWIKLNVDTSRIGKKKYWEQHVIPLLTM